MSLDLLYTALIKGGSDMQDNEQIKRENLQKIIVKMPKWIVLIPFVSILLATLVSIIPSISEAADKT